MEGGGGGSGDTEDERPGASPSSPSSSSNIVFGSSSTPVKTTTLPSPALQLEDLVAHAGASIEDDYYVMEEEEEVKEEEEEEDQDAVVDHAAEDDLLLVTPLALAKYVGRAVWEQVKAVGLVSGYLFFFLLVVLRAPSRDSAPPYGTILGGLVVLTLGLVLFLEGLQWGLMPLGQTIGRSLPLRLPIIVVLGICVLLGVGVTIAEPAIGALQAIGSLVDVKRAVYLYALLNQYSLLLILAVAIGVGFAAALGVFRFYRGWRMKPLVLVTLLPTIALSVILHLIEDLRPVIGLAWDCGAITTGPVTVPIVLAVGIGVASAHSSASGSTGSENAKPTNQSSAGGFGIVTLASLVPVIAVQTLGLLTYALVGAEEIRDYAAKQQKDDDHLTWYERTPQREIILSMRALIPLLIFLVVLLKLVLKESFPVTLLSVVVNDHRGNATEIVEEEREVRNKRKKLKKRRTSLFSNFSYHDAGGESGGDPNTLDVSIEMDEWDYDNDKPAHLNGIPAEEHGRHEGDKGKESEFTEMDQYKQEEGDDDHKDKAKEEEKRDLENGKVQAVSPSGRNTIYVYLLLTLVGLILFNIGLTKGLTLLGSETGYLIPRTFMAVSKDHNQHSFNDTTTENDGDTLLPPQFSYGFGLFIALTFSFVLGFGATYAEPALRVLGKQAEQLSQGRMKANVLIYSVCVGVGAGILLGIVKITFHLPLLYLLLPAYGVAVLLTLVSGEEFINVAWDCGGVTTGPVTVPLVLSLGLAFGNAVEAVDGFGILTMASVGPVAAVLAVSQILTRLEQPLQRLQDRIQEFRFGRG